MNISSFIKRYTLPLFVIAIISRGIEEINFIYYTVPFFLILFIIVALKEINYREIRFAYLIKWNKDYSDSTFPLSLLLLVLATTAWYILSALWSDYPIVSLERGLYFGLLATGCISGGYLWMKESGKNLFDYLLPANIIIIALSIFSLITNIPGDSWTGGHGKGFMGFFGHQNLLGSLILFTVPSVFSKLWIPVNGDQSIVKEKEIRVKSPLTNNYLPMTTYSLLLTSNLLILALTYSRASWLSLGAGFLTFLILIKNWKILIISFSLFTFIFILILSFPALNKAFNKILLKDFNTVLESRLLLWEPSFEAAKIGGLVGLGYGISEPNKIVPGTGSYYEGERYVREKGNSVLALIEESGIIGLIFFILPIGYIFSKNKKLRTTSSKPGTSNFEQSISYNHFVTNAFFIAILLTFLIHSQFEAWMVGVGSVQLPLFLVFIGVTIFISNNSTIKGLKTLSINQ